MRVAAHGCSLFVRAELCPQMGLMRRLGELSMLSLSATPGRRKVATATSILAETLTSPGMHRGTLVGETKPEGWAPSHCKIILYLVCTHTYHDPWSEDNLYSVLSFQHVECGG